FLAQQVRSFVPQPVGSWDVGCEATLFVRGVRFTGVASASDDEDVQLALSNCPQAGAGFAVPCALPANAGDAKVKGVEVETTIRPIDGLLIDGSASYTDFDYVADSLDPASGILPGMVSTYTPEWKWSLGVQY